MPWLFLAAQGLTLATLFGGAWWLGRAVLTTPWALACWIAALTLRHRIAKTGVNTLEGYFHPRVLVCGLGLISVALVLRGRPWWALALALASGFVHPTTAACFVVIVAVAILVTRPRARRPLGGAALAVAAVVVVRAWQGHGPFDLSVMDAEWQALVATKDYTFPTAWSAETWAINLAGPMLLTGAIAGAPTHRARICRPSAACWRERCSSWPASWPRCRSSPAV